ncbi:GGDEF domain-containing protein [Sphingomonas caeni]|uniref:GGDEF domain-containing protein n=1 Tax=Sphingomonas caeni TaxID=2984949 RepID=UPI002230DB7D|nr:GGDEF domain-containing protein [Sphingomonas caeni]
MRLPILGMGLVVAGVAGLTAFEWHDPVNGALAALALILTLARLLVLQLYWRDRPIVDDAQLRHWERRYAIGNYAFALLLAALNINALTIHQPLLHLITVSLVFSFGAGVVSRISIRPVICVVSLLLATVPTAAALAVHAFIPHGAELHSELFAIEALLVAMITALSLQTVAHLYRSAVVHHTAKHDLAQLARYDALTGLPNRLLLRERFRESSLAAAQTETRLAVHFIDLDGFKGINDRHGHPAGDSVLQQVARRLEGIIRADDTVARLGGDEFIVLQTDVGHGDEAEMLARRIIKQLSAPYEVEGEPMRISASVGIAMMPDYGRDLEELLSCADAALYRSKGAGKARVNFCTREDAASARLAAA